MTRGEEKGIRKGKELRDDRGKEKKKEFEKERDREKKGEREKQTGQLLLIVFSRIVRDRKY